MQLHKNLCIILVFTLITFIIPFSACNTSENQIGNQIITQLQKETPFTIVIPAYLPKGMHLAQYGIPSKQVIGEIEYVEISLTYEDGGLDKSIFIIETSVERTYALDVEDTYIYIHGTQIAKYASKLDLEISGYGYSWNMNGVNFDVNIYGYNEVERNKIIESMIK